MSKRSLVQVQVQLATSLLVLLQHVKLTHSSKLLEEMPMPQHYGNMPLQPNSTAKPSLAANVDAVTN